MTDLAQAYSRVAGLTFQIESKPRGQSPDPSIADQCSSPANAEATGPEQYRSFSVLSVLGAVALVRPERIVRWHCAGFRAYWPSRSRNPVGRPKVSAELCALIDEMSRANSDWAAARISV